MKTCIILRGVSGSGKSTLATALGDLMFKDAVVCSADHYMVDENGKHKYEKSRLDECHDRCWRKFITALADQHPLVIVDNTNTKPEHFSEYRHHATGKNYLVFVLVVENWTGTTNIHSVPEAVLQWQENNIKESLKLR